MTGKNHSPEARQRMSEAHKGEKNPMFGKKFSSETRQKISKSRIEFLQNHPEALKTRGIRGKFFSKKNGGIWLHYRSLLEKGWYQILEKLTKVKRYWIEPIVIKYNWNGSIHRYLPDLVVLYTDGSFDMIEVKPEYQRKTTRNQAKFKAAKEWCSRCHRHQIQFKVVGKKKG